MSSVLKTIKKATLISIITIASFNAQAAVTSYNSDGVDLVYSSVSNVTWTKDANLLGTLFASNGFEDTVNAIIAASPTVTSLPSWFNQTGSYTLSPNDFRENGIASWWGAVGFTNYLNTINYGGNSDWRLPTFSPLATGYRYDPPVNGTILGDELQELFYHDLGTKVDEWGNTIADTSMFINVGAKYWSGTEDIYGPGGAWYFDTDLRDQYHFPMDLQLYAWAISSVVPEPETYATLFAGLSIISFASRRK